MNVFMEEQGPPSSSSRRGSGLRASTKSKAPPPPQRSDPGWGPMEQDELALVVVLPGGAEKTTSVHGSKPLMDLLVMLCAQYHLSPSSHTLELVTANRNHVKFKPNAPIGALGTQRVLLKAKGDEDKNRTVGPPMPEQTVRMVINYKRSQKTILRVNPRVPLAELLPAICEKCEFERETTVLLLDADSHGPLDLSSSLNDYAIRDVYARDTRDDLDSPVCPTSPSQSVTLRLGKDKNQKEKENKGFSIFRRSKKRSEQPTTASAPASPVLVSKPRPLSMALPSMHPSPLDRQLSLEAPRKRRAPQPPGATPLSRPTPPRGPRPLSAEPSSPDRDQTGLRRGSTDSKSIKRKAPPPPSPPAGVQDPPSPPPSLQERAQGNSTLEEISEQEEAPPLCDPQLRDQSCPSADLSTVAPPPADLSTVAPPPADLSTVGPQGPAPPPAGTSGDQPGDLSTYGESTHNTVGDAVGDIDTRPERDAVVDVDPRPVPVLMEGPAERGPVEVLTKEPLESHGRSVGPAPAPPLIPPPPPPQTPPPPHPHGVETGEPTAPPLPLPAPPGEPTAPPLPVPAASPGSQRVEALEEPAPPRGPPASGWTPGAEPKPKPSNELTRGYTPRVGLTTYTVVPQKALEKLRYFEVEVTLQLPPPPPPGAPDPGALRGLPPPPEEQDGLLPPGAAAGGPGSTAGVGLPPLPQQTAPGDAASSSPTNHSEVKQVKVPPLTKPKPGSFRRPPLSSAEVRRLSSLPAARPAGAPADRALLPLPPPPPSAMQGPERSAGAPVEGGWAARGPTAGLSLDKLRSFAAPRPYTPSTPSRFAQAVSSAVRRTQSLSQAPASPASASPASASRASASLASPTSGASASLASPASGASAPLASPASGASALLASPASGASAPLASPASGASASLTSPASGASASPASPTSPLSSPVAGRGSPDLTSSQEESTSRP